MSVAVTKQGVTLPWTVQQPPQLGVMAKPLPWLMLGLWVDPVVPGQPIPISWEIWSANLTLDIGKITATIADGNNLLYTSPSPVPYVVQGNSGDSGLQTLILPPDKAQDLYKIGSKTLHLELTGTGKDAGPYATDGDLEVIPENVNQSWWEWGGPASPRSVGWKEGYSLAGVFHNYSKYSQMTTNLALFDDTGANPGNQLPVVPRGTPINVNFTPEIKQQWEWMLPFVWQIDGPTEKTFDYTVEMTLADSYGNTYQKAVSSRYRVHVKVSDEKVVLAGGALLNMVAAADLAIAALAAIPWWPVVAVLTGLASLALSIAQGLGLGAQDPPVPDSRFREPVQVIYPEIPPALAADSRGAALGSVLILMGRIAAADAALSQIEGRLLGARLARDPQGAQMQRASYQQVVNQMATDSDSLLGVIGAIPVDNVISPPALANTVTTWQQQGVPSDAHQQLSQAGMSEGAIAQIDQAIRNPTVARQAATGLIPTLGLAAVALGGYVRGVQRRTPAVLAGTQGGINMTLTPSNWKISENRNQYRGDLIINSVDPQGRVTGTVFGNPITGFWDDLSRRIRFTRLIDFGTTNVQQYTGALVTDPTGADPTWHLIGTFTQQSETLVDATVYDWHASTAASGTM